MSSADTVDGDAAGAAEAEADAADGAAEAPDLLRQRLVDELRAELGDAVVDVALAARPRPVGPGAPPTPGCRPARLARDQLGLHYFCFLSVIDWLPSPFGRSMDADVDQVLAGETATASPSR